MTRRRNRKGSGRGGGTVAAPTTAPPQPPPPAATTTAAPSPPAAATTSAPPPPSRRCRYERSGCPRGAGCPLPHRGEPGYDALPPLPPTRCWGGAGCYRVRDPGGCPHWHTPFELVDGVAADKQGLLMNEAVRKSITRQPTGDAAEDAAALAQARAAMAAARELGFQREAGPIPADPREPPPPPTAPPPPSAVALQAQGATWMRESILRSGVPAAYRRVYGADVGPALGYGCTIERSGDVDHPSESAAWRAVQNELMVHLTPSGLHLLGPLREHGIAWTHAPDSDMRSGSGGGGSGGGGGGTALSTTTTRGSRWLPLVHPPDAAGAGAGSRQPLVLLRAVLTPVTAPLRDSGRDRPLPVLVSAWASGVGGRRYTRGADGVVTITTPQFRYCRDDSGGRHVVTLEVNDCAAGGDWARLVLDAGSGEATLDGVPAVEEAKAVRSRKRGVFCDDGGASLWRASKLRCRQCGALEASAGRAFNQLVVRTEGGAEGGGAAAGDGVVPPEPLYEFRAVVGPCRHRCGAGSNAGEDPEVDEGDDEEDEIWEEDDEDDEDDEEDGGSDWDGYDDDDDGYDDEDDESDGSSEGGDDELPTRLTPLVPRGQTLGAACGRE